MLLLATSDWHIRDRKPRYRKDDFLQAQYNKIEFILSHTKQIGAQLVIAGDIFDKYNISYATVARYIRLFRKYGVCAWACAGQHDQHHHSQDLTGTAYELLMSAGCITAPEYSMDWGGDQKDTDILIAHACVTEKPMEFIEYSVTAAEFMKVTKSRIIITGDYHATHIRKEDDRLLVNPGSIMRAAKNEIDKKPVIFLIDTDSLLVEPIYLPINEDVFDMGAIDSERVRQTRKSDVEASMAAFAELARSYTTAADFAKNLERVSLRCSEPAKDKLKEWCNT